MLSSMCAVVSVAVACWLDGCLVWLAVLGVVVIVVGVAVVVVALLGVVVTRAFDSALLCFCLCACWMSDEASKPVAWATASQMDCSQSIITAWHKQSPPIG